MTLYQLFATTPKAMEDILAEELKQLGAEQVKPKLAGVTFQGNLEMAYRACLWSRTANRILLPLSSFEVKAKQDLYDAVKKINWFEHFKPDDTFAVSFSARNSTAINNSHFGSLVVKDAIVDQMRAKFHKRPNIDLHRPTIKINVYLNTENAQLSLDLSGESLHKRGYREDNVQAPIKENLAAAMLLRSGWPQIAKKGGSLIDPMCGSGTLLLEAAMISADYAPGLLRDYFGFMGWKQHDNDCWQKLLTEAENRKNTGLKQMPTIAGFDQSRRTVATAIKHADNADLQNKIHIEKREISDAKPADSWQTGLLICNPPYGERLGDEEHIAELYLQFGQTLKSFFQGWKASLIISNPEMGFRLGIRSQKPITLFNGAIECKLLRLNIEEKSFFIPKAKSQQERIAQITQGQPFVTDGNSKAEMFSNRLKKNLKKMAKWAKQQNISCYRLYDADLPEYAVAIDVYKNDELWVNVQEYEAPKTISPEKANQRLAGLLAEIPDVLNIDKSQVFLKIRRKQKSTDQYQKQNDKANYHIIEEGNCRFLVNFEDYLDTGLFLDHRPIRLRIQKEAKGKNFLNLFAYTGTASIHAAIGGALSTTTVDMSNSYLDWAKKNFDLNKLTGNHKIIRADCSKWLEEKAHQATDKTLYDFIFLDPPTFSNSKRMENVFDIQKDHVALINNALKILSPKGTLYFSTNFRQFKLDKLALSQSVIEDISASTIPDDFLRNPRVHYCWKILNK